MRAWRAALRRTERLSRFCCGSNTLQKKSAANSGRGAGNACTPAKRRAKATGLGGTRTAEAGLCATRGVKGRTLKRARCTPCDARGPASAGVRVPSGRTSAMVLPRTYPPRHGAGTRGSAHVHCALIVIRAHHANCFSAGSISVTSSGDGIVAAPSSSPAIIAATLSAASPSAASRCT